MSRFTLSMQAITPVLTADAFGKVHTLRPSALLGSLRHWFEIVCRTANTGVTNPQTTLNCDRFINDVQSVLIQNMHPDIDIMKMKAAAKQLSLPSLIFGCTGWKSAIQISKIKILKNKKWDGLIADRRFSECDIRKVHIEFEVHPEIQERILFPLLHFIENYGYIGSKNNIGFGRVRFFGDQYSPSNQTFDFTPWGSKKISFSQIVDDKIQELNDLYTCKKIGLYKEKDCGRDLKDIFHKLKLLKNEAKSNVRPDYQLFPWVRLAEEGIYEYGLVSVIFNERGKDIGKNGVSRGMAEQREKS